MIIDTATTYNNASLTHNGVNQVLLNVKYIIVIHYFKGARKAAQLCKGNELKLGKVTAVVSYPHGAKGIQEEPGAASSELYN